MANKNISFKDVVARQQADIKSRKKGNTIYVKISLPFTYLLLKLGATPNKLTLFTYLLGIFGYIFLSIGTYLYFIIGIVSFFLFYTLDSSDGDIARILNQKSIEGIFFDEISHYVWAICFGTGIGVGLSKIYSSGLYLYLGLAITLVISLEHSITYAMRSSIKTGMMEMGMPLKNYKPVMDRLSGNIQRKIVWSKTSMIHKLFGIYPFNGLFYSAYFSCPIILILALTEYIFKTTMGHQITGIGFIVPYLLVLFIAKLIWILTLSYNIERHRYITDALDNFKK